MWEAAAETEDGGEHLRREMRHGGDAGGFFGSLKTELMEDGTFDTRQAARSALFAFIEGFYNRQRLHSAIGHKAPTEMEQLTAAA